MEKPGETQSAQRHSVLSRFVPPVEAKGILFSGFCKTGPSLVSHRRHRSKAARFKDVVVWQLSTRGFHSSRGAQQTPRGCWALLE